jgi:hypothetical protein
MYAQLDLKEIFERYKKIHIVFMDFGKKNFIVESNQKIII